jgi:hypothetical protein
MVRDIAKPTDWQEQSQRATRRPHFCVVGTATNAAPAPTLWHASV